MNKTVLVIGEVTRDQYQEVRIGLLQQGHQPKVVRVNSEDFFLDSAGLAEKYVAKTEMVRSGFDMSSTEYPNELYDQCAALHLESFGSIGAIVVHEDTWEHWAVYGPRYICMMSVLADSDSAPTRWIAYPGGAVEFAGEL